MTAAPERTYTREAGGQVHLYVGAGAGDVPSALGLAARAAGSGFRVVLVTVRDERPADLAWDVLARLPEVSVRAAPAVECLGVARETLQAAAGSVGPRLLVIDRVLHEKSDEAPGEASIVSFLEEVRRDHPALEVALSGEAASALLRSAADLVTELGPAAAGR